MPRLKNLTITVEEDVALWARMEAAKEDTRVYRLVGEKLRESKEYEGRYENAMKQAPLVGPF